MWRGKGKGMKTRSQSLTKRVTIDTTRDIRFYRPGPVTRRLSERALEEEQADEQGDSALLPLSGSQPASNPTRSKPSRGRQARSRRRG